MAKNTVIDEVLPEIKRRRAGRTVSILTPAGIDARSNTVAGTQPRLR